MMNMLMGSGNGPVVSLPTGITASVVNPGVAVCSVNFSNTGTVTADGTSVPNWLVAGAASSCEIRLTVTSGAVSAGSDSTGVWLSLGTSRSWNRTQSGAGSSQWAGTIEIRSAATGVVLASTSVGGVTCQANAI